MGRRVTTGVAVGLAVILGTVLALRQAGDVVRRPEGAAERFLQAVSAEEDDRIDRYGTRALAEQLRTFPREDAEEDWFLSLEVGRRVEEGDGYARVPFRIERQDEGKTEVFGYLDVREQPGDEPREWKVDAVLLDPAAADQVPSGGGSEPATASGGTWLVGVLLATSLILVVELLLRLAGGRRPAEAGQRAGGDANLD